MMEVRHNTSRLTAVTDESGYRTEFTYNAVNRSTKVTKTDGTKESFVFNPNGNLVTFYNGLGNARTFAQVRDNSRYLAVLRC